MSESGGEVERSVDIRNAHGLHARPAAEFVKVAKAYRSEVRVIKDELEVNGKSIMGVMMLAAEAGSTITIRADGEDAAQAVHKLAELVENGFGES